jgi:hypothetical protein
MAALERAGVKVVKNPALIGEAVKDAIGGKPRKIAARARVSATRRRAASRPKAKARSSAKPVRKRRARPS